MARFMSPKSADAGFSIFAATVIFALAMIASDVSAGWGDAEGSLFAAAGGSLFAATTVGFAVSVAARALSWA